MSTGENLMRFAERDGVRIHFEVVGAGPPVVLLHGAAGDRTMWRHAGYVDGLEGYSCVLVDSRGHGLSDKPTDEAAYSLEEYAADVEAVHAPALLLVGAAEDPEDEAAKVAALLPSGRAVTLTSAGHIGAFLASEQALSHALQVLRRRLCGLIELHPACWTGRIEAPSETIDGETGP